MARVPRAADIGVSSFNVGSAAQIDIGVAKNIGAAGNAIGQAVAALGGAFGELAGRVQATEQAGAYSGLINDLYDADARIETEAYKNAAPDGSHWDGAATQYGEASDKWRQDPRWNNLTPKQRASAENAHRDLTRRRAIGTDSYIERSRKDKVNFQTGKVGEAINGSLVRLGVDQPRNVGIAPQVYNERVDAEQALVFDRIDGMTGTVFSPAQAEAAKNEAARVFGLQKAQWLAKNDPEGAEKFFEGYGKLDREELAKPSYLGGPGGKSDGQKLGAIDPSEFNDHSKGRGGRPLRTVENIILHDVSGPGGGRVPKGGNIPNYHITFDKNGVYLENQLDRQAPHAYKLNKNSIGIAHIGYEGDKLDPKAIENGAKAVAYVMQQTGVPAEKILTHPGAGPSATKTGKDQREASWRTEVLEYIDKNKATLLAGKADSIGSAQSGGFKANLTAYSPKKGGDAVQGGYRAARAGPGQDPKDATTWKVMTLADVVAGKSEYVTLAGNPKQYGKEYVIPQITYVDKSGKEHTLKNVRAVVHDTGGAFKKAGADRFDVPVDRDVSEKVRNANHDKWDKEGVQFVEAGKAGATEVAKDSSRPEGMMTLGAGDVANATQAAEAAGIDIAKLAQLSPETTFGEAVEQGKLSEEELAAIQARAPEGVNVREVTVAEAGELIGQVAGAPQTMNDAGPQEQVQAREPMMGNIKDGQELTVPSGNGFMKFDARQLRAIPKSLLKDMEKQFAAKRRAATNATSKNAKEMMRLQEESLDKTFQDIPGYNPAILDRAFPRGTPEREKHERNVAVSRQLGKIFGDDASVSSLELKERMEELAPVTPPEGGDSLLYKELREKADERLKKIMDLRREDPAKAVERHPLVAEVMAGFEGGRPRNAEDRVKLARARMAAQKDIDIESWNRTPIDDGEARGYVNDLDSLPDDQLEAGLTEMMVKIKKQFGEEHSGVVLNAIVRELSKTDERKAHLVNEARRISDRDALGLGPYDIDSANAMYDMEGVERSATMYRGIGGSGKRAQERMFQEVYDRTRTDGTTEERSWFQRRFPRVSESMGLNRSKEPPSKEDLKLLQKRKLTPEAFAKKYGMTEAEARSAFLGLTTTNRRPRN